MINLTSLPWMLEDPFVNTIQVLIGSSTCGAISTMKFMKDCAFSVFLHSKDKSNSYILMDHFVIRSTRFDRWSICFISMSIWMTMSWTNNKVINLPIYLLILVPPSLSFYITSLVCPRLWRWNRLDFRNYSFLLWWWW